MKKPSRLLFLLLALIPMGAAAQICSNPDKFIGNITTGYQVDAGGGVPQFYKLWNQITCENESKWGSVEGTRGSFNWGCETAFSYARQHQFTYKFHALVWGAQYPGWLPALSPRERFNAIVSWFDAVKKKYPTMPMFDVVNEAVGNHQKDNPMIKESLGGGGKTGYDWLIKAFEMAYERWPNSILIYNDYNTFQWNTNEYIELVKTLRDAGAPIDAYGCQSHDLTDCDFNNFKNAETKIQNALQMPMYSTEYDIGTSDDAKQLQRYKEQIPYMWEKPYCAGITLWGYVYGRTWTTDGNSGIYRNGQERPAMTWLKEYMASEAAQKAVSPFPGMKKEASIYIRPASMNVAKNDVLPIMVRARMATKTIEKVELYVGNTLVATMTEPPYLAEYTATSAGAKTLKAVVTATDGTTYERYSSFTVLSGTTKRQPYLPAVPQLPGTIQVGEYDKGLAGVSYNNATRGIAATKDGAWMEYTVDVAEEGIYTFDAEVASTKSGGSFYLAEYGFENLDFLTEFIDVPKTGGQRDFQVLHGQLQMPLTAGRHVICLNVTKGGFIIKSLTFNRYDEDKANIVAAIKTITPSTISVGDSALITLTATSRIEDAPIDHVSVYADNLLIGTLTEEPYELTFRPAEKGTYSIVAVATTTQGKSRTSTKKTLKVNGKRVPYKNTMAELPGIIEAENFDQGGEAFTFHDTDDNDQGDAKCRTDNEGLDLVKGNGGAAIGYTAKNEWTEYSVRVTEPGEYAFEATCSNGASSNGGFTINLVRGTTVTQLAKVTVTPTGGWDTYKVMSGKFTKQLGEGEQILRFTITDANCNIDKVEFRCTLNTPVEDLAAEPHDLLSAPRYNLSGQQVRPGYRGIVIIGGRKVLMK